MSPPPAPGPTPESLFASWLARHEAGEAAPFDQLCRQYADSSERLRELHREWQELRGVLDRAGFTGSLTRRLEGLQGSGDDPRASLRGEAPEDDLPSGLLERLAGRGSASTRYRLEGEVAHGGMGVVLRVWDEDLRRPLAMKVLLGRSEGSGGATPPVGRRVLARFLEEAQVTGQLDHPGIVPVHELGLDAHGQVFFTMKLVRGQTLRSVFDELAAGRGGWTRTRVLGLIVRVCEAMSYAHAKGVIHRDLKPANVMVGKFGEVYVMDWGLAKILGREDARDLRIRPRDPPSEVLSDRQDEALRTADSPLCTMDGDVVGTPAYMPPEQAAGRVDRMGPASDVYAVGAMLYHLLAGHMPYVPPQARISPYALLQLVKLGPPASLLEQAPDAPGELVAICERAMARDAAVRYPDMRALAEDLAAFVEGRVVQAYETGAWAEARKWVRRNRPLAASLAAALALLIAGLATTLVLERKARGNFELAERRRLESEENEALAAEQARLANERADDVLRLSALQDLEDLLLEADGLWPAYPERAMDLRSWIERAEALVAELPRQRAKREELRALALPRSEAQRIAEREGHPEFPRFTRLQGRHSALRRALRQRRNGIAAELPLVDWSEHPENPSDLNAEAWELVDPERETFGLEPLALVLSRRALELAGDDPGLRATIENTVALAAFALGRDEEALAASFSALESAPAARKTEFEGYLKKVEKGIEAATSDEGLGTAARELAALESELALLEAKLEERREWSFPAEHGEARWWNAQLSKLIEGLEAVLDEEVGLLAPEAVSPDLGWSVPRRLAFARRLERDFAEGGRYARRWEDSLAALRAAYPAADLVPQMGLVPIGPDAASGLWEFWDVATGVEPERGPDGALVLTEEMGVVLVLLPGGSFWMGAQKENPDGQNYDPQAATEEGPVHQVTLTPFFVSKYEMTQGQWLRIAGHNPSFYRAPGTQGMTLLDTLEQVSWLDCMRVLPRAGLTLPSEAQWEYACRAGTDTPWWTGRERETLLEQEAANLADQSAARAGAPWASIRDWPELDDGYSLHAPIGSHAANLFGLHEVIGNLWEWCLDGYDKSFYLRSPALDPVMPPASSYTRMYRGGGFAFTAADSRSARRGSNPPAAAEITLGVRPARPLGDR